MMKSECNRSPDDIPITERCIALKRLCTASLCFAHCKRLCAASKYYDALCGAKMDEEDKKALLVEFMETVYHSVLDDTAHFIEEHAGDLQQVWKEWTERYGFAKCTTHTIHSHSKLQRRNQIRVTINRYPLFH